MTQGYPAHFVKYAGSLRCYSTEHIKYVLGKGTISVEPRPPPYAGNPHVRKGHQRVKKTLKVLPVTSKKPGVGKVCRKAAQPKLGDWDEVVTRHG